MAQKVNITYSSPGLQPPVFLTTSLTHPQWEPVEMGVTTDADGNHVFSKEFEATEGHYQYKFRLGVGDWWVFDEGKPTVDDGFGNKNNLLVVEQPSSKAEEKTELPTTAPLLQREANADPEKNASEEVPVRTDPDLEPSKSTNSQEAEEEDAPLLKHEMAPTEDGKDRPQQTSLLSTPDLSRLSDKSQPDEVVAPEPSQADRAALEKFPEDHNGIMESIHKVSSNAPVDQVSDQPEEAVSRSRALSSASSSLPSVKEHDIEETVPEPEPAHPAVVSETSNPTVPEDSKASRPAEPITPPMTPKDENRPHAPASELENMGEEGPVKDDDRASQDESPVSTPKASTTSPVRSIVRENAKKKGLLAAFLDLFLGVGHWFSGLCGGKANTTALLLGISLSLAAGAWKLWLADQNGFVFEKSAIVDRLREFKF